LFKRQKVDKIPEAAIAKWSQAVIEEGFIPFPKRFLRVLSGVFKSEEMKLLQALLAIVDFRRAKQAYPPSRDYLAFIAGLPDDEFGGLLRDLKSRGLIEVAMESDEWIVADIQGLLRRIIELTPEEPSLDGADPF
jgi:hypothetical protein